MSRDEIKAFRTAAIQWAVAEEQALAARGSQSLEKGSAAWFRRATAPVGARAGAGDEGKAAAEGCGEEGETDSSKEVGKDDGDEDGEEAGEAGRQALGLYAVAAAPPPLAAHVLSDAEVKELARALAAEAGAAEATDEEDNGSDKGGDVGGSDSDDEGAMTRHPSAPRRPASGAPFIKALIDSPGTLGQLEARLTSGTVSGNRSGGRSKDAPPEPRAAATPVEAVAQRASSLSPSSSLSLPSLPNPSSPSLSRRLEPVRRTVPTPAGPPPALAAASAHHAARHAGAAAAEAAPTGGSGKGSNEGICGEGGGSAGVALVHRSRPRKGRPLAETVAQGMARQAQQQEKAQQQMPDEARAADEVALPLPSPPAPPQTDAPCTPAMRPTPSRLRAEGAATAVASMVPRSRPRSRPTSAAPAAPAAPAAASVFELLSEASVPAPAPASVPAPAASVAASAAAAAAAALPSPASSRLVSRCVEQQL